MWHHLKVINHKTQKDSSQPTRQVKEQKFPLSHYPFNSCAKHPKRKHIEQDVLKTSMHKHMSNQLPRPKQVVVREIKSKPLKKQILVSQKKGPRKNNKVDEN